MAEPAPKAENGYRILVVEDDRDTVLSLALLLQMNGYRTAIAHGGKGVIEVGKRFLAQVVLLDNGLHG